jgi:phosphoribosylformylglycinamidine synthase
MAYLARIDITLKPAVNDPQGNTIRDALHTLGFKEVGSVRAGKYMEIRLETSDKSKAKQQVTEMCKKLLANPVIEDFSFEIEEAS